MTLLTKEEMLELADDIEASDGIALLKPIGPIQIGIRRTAAIIDFLRRMAKVQPLPDVPHGRG